MISEGALGERWERPELSALEEVKLEGLSFRNVNVAHSNGAAKCANVIGMEVLSRHRLVFDLKNRRIWFLPRSGSIAEGDS
jgi:hypothetical protein